MDITMKPLAALLILCLLMACAPTPAPVLPPPTVRQVLRTPAPAVTPYPTPTRAPTWTPEATFTPAPVLITPDPFEAYTITKLRVRQYGGGEIENLKSLGGGTGFTRYEIRYPSDGLNIYGFANIPQGEGPFPVVIALHGYVNPLQYQTLDYTTEAADELASNGFLVLHPNLRNFPPSDNGDVTFRAGYAIDVLNLIAILRQQAGKPGLLEKARADKLGIWAHSLGGDIALKVAVISREVKAILLYAPMSGDEQKNSQFFNFMTGNPVNQQEMLASAETFRAVSPATYYRDITAAIQIHHGTGDTIIPITWATETCQAMQAADLPVECYYYDGAEHTFRSRYIPDFAPRVSEFFNRYLR
jgi:dienelactone hydrolase